MTGTFLGPPERARVETGGADQWVLKRRELLGCAIVNGEKSSHPWNTHSQFSIKTLLSKHAHLQLFFATNAGCIVLQSIAGCCRVVVLQCIVLLEELLPRQAEALFAECVAVCCSGLQCCSIAESFSAKRAAASHNSDQSTEASLRSPLPSTNAGMMSLLECLSVKAIRTNCSDGIKPHFPHALRSLGLGWDTELEERGDTYVDTALFKANCWAAASPTIRAQYQFTKRHQRGDDASAPSGTLALHN